MTKKCTIPDFVTVIWDNNSGNLFYSVLAYHQNFLTGSKKTIILVEQFNWIEDLINDIEQSNYD